VTSLHWLAGSWRVRLSKTIPIVGFINSVSPKPYAPNVDGFLQGLKEAGYIEGQNVAIEYRWAEGRYDRLPGLAAELVRRDVTVIVANTPAAPSIFGRLGNSAYSSRRRSSPSPTR